MINQDRLSQPLKKKRCPKELKKMVILSLQHSKESMKPSVPATSQRSVVSTGRRIVVSTGQRSVVSTRQRIVISTGERRVVSKGQRIVVSTGQRSVVSTGQLIDSSARKRSAPPAGHRRIPPAKQQRIPAPRQRSISAVEQRKDLPTGQQISSSASTITGIKNMGNTCYLSSILQALYHTREFSNKMILAEHKSSIYKEIARVFGGLRFINVGNVIPKKLYDVIINSSVFVRNQQQDCAEFTDYILNTLHTQENLYQKGFSVQLMQKYNQTNAATGAAQSSTSSSTRDSRNDDRFQSGNSVASSSTDSSSGNATFVDSMFGGVQLTVTQCLVCNMTSRTSDKFRSLHLCFPDKHEHGKVSVQMLIDLYCTTETLAGDNMYNCVNCRGLRNAQRTAVVENAPEYLILILKRFKYDIKTNQLEKLMTPTYNDYTITLPTLPGRNAHYYNLYAAIIHKGTSLNAGHYYTIALNGDTWFVFDDEIVYPAADEEIINKLNSSSTPYILFYCKSDREATPEISLQELPQYLKNSIINCNKQLEQVAKTLSY